jgi:hypothetical protein
LRAAFWRALQCGRTPTWALKEAHEASLGGLGVRPLAWHSANPSTLHTMVQNPNLLAHNFLEQLHKILETLLVTSEDSEAINTSDNVYLSYQVLDQFQCSSENISITPQ